MAKVSLKTGLLGYPSVHVDGLLIDNFVTKRAEALFYYLVVTRRAHSRDTLAALFWPDMAEVKGKKNLRNALPVLRKLFGDYLVISRDAVAFANERPFTLDTDALATAVAQYQPNGDPTELETAVAGYKGEFLEGFHIDNTPEFSNWIFSQAEYWRGLFIQGLHLLAAHYLQQHQYIQGLAITGRLLDVEPWSESAYRQRMLLFAHQQQRSAALKTYAQCQQALRDVFDITPMVETIALYNRIRAEETNGAETVTPLHNLPRELTPFFGRKDELRQIREKALDRRYPLTTIVGEGGMGKSRLALTAVTQLLYDFPEGVWFVPLIGIDSSTKDEESETALAQAIAQALQIPLSGNTPITDQVLAYLQQKRMLLALDNMEHLVNGAGFVVQILRQAKQVQLIVTSRRRLNLQVEYPFRLQGLPTPTANADSEIDDVSSAQAHSSIQLFTERATRARPEFTLTRQNVTAVSQICRLVDGLPLGIELAAALLNQRDCAEIVAYIERDANQLGLEMQDLPLHHRSVWALFDYSWQLLATHERQILAQNAVFASGFTLEAATAIAQATETDLTNLIHQSLLTRDENGRYNLHPLVQQFAHKKWLELAEQETSVAAVAKRHAHYYLQTCFVDYAEIWQTPLPVLQVESSNKQLAWSNAIQSDNFALLAEAAEGWIAYWDRLSLSPESITMLRQALRAINKKQLGASEWIAMLQIRLAWLLCHIGEYQETSDLAENTLTLTETPAIVEQVYFLLSIVMWCTGFVDKAEEFHKLALVFHDETNVLNRINLLRNESTICGLLSKHGESIALLEKSLGLLEHHHYPREKGIALSNLGVTYQFSGQLYKAVTCYWQAYEIAIAIGYVRGQAYALSNLVPTYTQLGLYKEADDCLQKGLPISRNLNDKHLHAEFIVYRACLKNALQQYDDALEDAQLALTSLAQIESYSSMVFSYRAMGDAWLGKENWAQAAVQYEQLLAHCTANSLLEAMMEPLAGLAFIAYKQGDEKKMRERSEQILSALPTAVTTHEFIGNFMDVYWRLYVVLNHLGDERATGVLETAVSQLQTQAEQITDSAVRKQFLDNIQSHRELMRVAG